MIDHKKYFFSQKSLILLFLITFLGFFLRAYKIDSYSHGGLFCYQLDFLHRLLIDPFNLKNPEFIYTQLYKFIYPPFYKYFLILFNKSYFLFGLISGHFQSFSDLVSAFEKDYSGILLTHRIVELLISLATIPVVYLISRRLFKNYIFGLIAALFIAVCPLHIGCCFEIRPDVLQFFFFCVSFLYISKIFDGDLARKNYILSGIFIALATASRYSGLLGVLPLIFAHFCSNNKNRYLYLSLIVVIVSFFILCFPIFLSLNAFIDSGMVIKYNLIDMGLKKAYQSIGWIDYPLSLRASLGTGIALISLLGLFLAVIRHNRRDILMLIFPFSYYLLIGSVRVCAAYHTLLLVLFMILFAINFLEFISTKIIKSWVFICILAIVLAVPSFKESVHFTQWISQKNMQPEFENWFRNNIPINSKVLSIGITAALDNRLYNFTNIEGEGDPVPESLYKGNSFDYIIINQSELVFAKSKPLQEYIDKKFILLNNFEQRIKNPGYKFCNIYSTFYDWSVAVYKLNKL
jgi:hypothetical protein